MITFTNLEHKVFFIRIIIINYLYIKENDNISNHVYKEEKYNISNLSGV